eukprot:COSAG06_NODE_59770_length_273_cov_0.591954_1_plen_64_part_10
MDVLEQLSVSSPRKDRKALLRTMERVDLGGRRIIKKLPGCPYRRTHSYQSTRRVVVFDLEGTGA